MTEGNGATPPARCLPDWITGFIHLTEPTNAPESFRRWAAISILGSILERRVWNKLKKGFLFPNLYIILVGQPGVGKSTTLTIADRLARNVGEIHIAPSSVTTASLVDTIATATRTVNHMQYNSLQVISSELQNFMPVYETQFVGMLTKLYDCELYEERRRTSKIHIKIDNTQLSLLAGTTPSFIHQLLPDAAWNQGFASRTIFVYGDKPQTDGIFLTGDNEKVDADLAADLLSDLKNIRDLCGQAVWNEDAKIAITKWASSGEKPVPNHTRLTHYNSRRTTHLLKLSTIISVSRSSELRVSLEDFHTASSLLFTTEKTMPEIFRQMTVTRESRTMEDAQFYMLQLYEKLQRPVPEMYLYDFLKQRCAPQYIGKTIEVMLKAHMLQQRHDDWGNSEYTP
jgi:hypothetical protein